MRSINFTRGQQEVVRQSDSTTLQQPPTHFLSQLADPKDTHDKPHGRRPHGNERGSSTVNMALSYAAAAAIAVSQQETPCSHHAAMRFLLQTQFPAVASRGAHARHHTCVNTPLMHDARARTSSEIPLTDGFALSVGADGHALSAPRAKRKEHERVQHAHAMQIMLVLLLCPPASQGRANTFGDAAPPGARAQLMHGGLAAMPLPPGLAPSASALPPLPPVPTHRHDSHEQHCSKRETSALRETGNGRCTRARANLPSVSRERDRDVRVHDRGPARQYVYTRAPAHAQTFVSAIMQACCAKNRIDHVRDKKMPAAKRPHDPG